MRPCRNTSRAVPECCSPATRLAAVRICHEITKARHKHLLVRLHLIDPHLADVEEQVEPPGPDRRIVDADDDLVSPRRRRPPDVRPQTPRPRRRRHRTVAHGYE